MKNLMEKLSPKARAVLVASVLGTGAGGYVAQDAYFSPVTAKEAVQKPVGSSVRLTMKVADSRDLGPQIGTLLNNVPYRNDPEGKSRVTVRVTPDTIGYDLVREKKMLGKNIWVKGTVDEFGNQKQILATEISSQ